VRRSHARGATDLHSRRSPIRPTTRACIVKPQVRLRHCGSTAQPMPESAISIPESTSMGAMGATLPIVALLARLDGRHVHICTFVLPAFFGIRSRNNPVRSFIIRRGKPAIAVKAGFAPLLRCDDPTYSYPRPGCEFESRRYVCKCVRGTNPASIQSKPAPLGLTQAGADPRLDGQHRTKPRYRKRQEDACTL
jgi:hypothetical protein